MKLANDRYKQFEQAALSVAHGGDSTSVDELVRLGPLAIDALSDSATALSTGTAGCGNGTLGADEWKRLHEEAAYLARVSQEVSSEFIELSQGGSIGCNEWMVA